jgi:MoxR-like ATPase
MYVSIQIGKDQSGYDAIQQFVASKTTHDRNLREVEGRCTDEDDDDDDMQKATPPPQLKLFPCKSWSLLDSTIDSQSMFVLVDETEHKITYKGHTLWVTSKKDGSIGNGDKNYYTNDIKDLFKMMNSNPCIHITMRGQDMNLLKSYIQEWINDHFEKEHGKLTIWKCMPVRYEGFGWKQLGSKELRPLESVILKDGQKDHILKDITTFRRREQWYSLRGIPYRRGYLLHGPPGTGKTSLVQSVASKINMNVAIISLSGSMDDEQFNVVLQDVPRNSILVMEDIDHCVIRDPSSDKDNSSAKITMSGFLNALDGVVAQEGSMVFMTCNDITRLQPALLRPGRIDMKMELGYADKTQIMKMFWRFMGPDDTVEQTNEKPIVSDHLNEIARKFTDIIPDLTVTPAELQNFFIMHVLDRDDLEASEKTVDYNYLLDAIPEFMESVKRDREQAADHASNVSGKNSSPTEKNNRKADNEDTGSGQDEAFVKDEQDNNSNDTKNKNTENKDGEVYKTEVDKTLAAKKAEIAL